MENRTHAAAVDAMDDALPFGRWGGYLPIGQGAPARAAVCVRCSRVAVEPDARAGHSLAEDAALASIQAIAISGGPASADPAASRIQPKESG